MNKKNCCKILPYFLRLCHFHVLINIFKHYIDWCIRNLKLQAPACFVLRVKIIKETLQLILPKNHEMTIFTALSQFLMHS